MRKIDDNKKNLETCKEFCGICPSYPRHSTSEWLFCARDKSAAKIKRNGCMCPSCQVYEAYRLVGDYYCAVGAAK